MLGKVGCVYGGCQEGDRREGREGKGRVNVCLEGKIGREEKRWIIWLWPGKVVGT